MNDPVLMVLVSLIFFIYINYLMNEKILNKIEMLENSIEDLEKAIYDLEFDLGSDDPDDPEEKEPVSETENVVAISKRRA